MESFPVQVKVNVTGNLPDGCTSIVGSKAEFIDNNTFVLSIYTERPEDLMCTMALVPFEESITLDVNGLAAGTYTVKGFDLEESFTLDVDNK
jgi:inhibitor of cysteine peptidase